MKVRAPITVNKLTLDMNVEQQSERNQSILLRLWTVQSLNLMGCKIQSVSVSVLLCHQGPVTLSLSDVTLQMMVECVYEAQEDELTECFLQKVGDDLTFCSLSWKEFHYFLQHGNQQNTVNLRYGNIQVNIREILPFLSRIKFECMSSVFILCVIREIYESGSAGFVSGLLSSVENYINLQCRDLDSVHCDALRFTLQHCTAASLNLQWTSIPEEELESILPLFTHVSHLSCDKSLLQFLAHVRPEEAESLSGALGEELDLRQTQLDPQVCRGLVLILEYCEGLTELDLSQCRLTDHSLDLLLPNLHKVQNIDFSGNNITDAGAQKIHSIVTRSSNIKTVRLFNNRIESREIFSTNPRFEIC
ncbi:hypothetical protein ROHU_014983 [Labeo rohita]|uniref:LRR and PYD domains-containing 14-like protein n=1 Tax=Labeo rohita TaxID=84645 RepID=A0A498NQC5_LABRO|nr:hypothetical protein ROHU_014983 [Labeo rohita]